MLEPRDQVLEHTFSFEEEIFKDDIPEGKDSLLGTNLYASILKKIKLFLVEAISNVVSVAFKFMCRG
jgi:hypothetical protein